MNVRHFESPMVAARAARNCSRRGNEAHSEVGRAFISSSPLVAALRLSRSRLSGLRARFVLDEGALLRSGALEGPKIVVAQGTASPTSAALGEHPAERGSLSLRE